MQGPVARSRARRARCGSPAGALGADTDAVLDELDDRRDRPSVGLRRWSASPFTGTVRVVKRRRRCCAAARIPRRGRAASTCGTRAAGRARRRTAARGSAACPRSRAELRGVRSQHGASSTRCSPHPGRSWAQTVPEEFVAATSQARAVDGPAPAVAASGGATSAMRALLLRTTSLRAEFVADRARAVPRRRCSTRSCRTCRMPPASFVQLSAAYEPETAAARERRLADDRRSTLHRPRAR